MAKVQTYQYGQIEHISQQKWFLILIKSLLGKEERRKREFCSDFGGGECVSIKALVRKKKINKLGNLSTP
ncbi:hypothetical protein Scep_007784 [Stephania cephalantha]|uniref:Uncharacterized protein n=1 Tax=Stephania cephalantha TaxID=152367 RepID=A0AAP0KD79_9MAGN